MYKAAFSATRQLPPGDTILQDYTVHQVAVSSNETALI